jgi:hypothetical protein
VETLLIYAFCTASMFYLGSRALITSWLWGHYPPKFALFMDCSACSGTWYGAAVAYIGGYHLGLDFLGLHGAAPTTVAVAALCSMAFTPIAAGLVQRGFDSVGSAVAPEAPVIPELPNRDAEVQALLQARNPVSYETSGTITPREIPIPVLKVVIPPKEETDSGG